MPDNKVFLKAQGAHSASPRAGFAGRSALVDGLFSGARDKKEDEILASRYILETVIQLVEARVQLGKYEALLRGEAAAILRDRASAQAAEAGEPAVQGKPKNEEEALVFAVKRIGLEGRVTSTRTSPSGNFILGLEIEGNECHVMLPHDTMAREDPVGYVEELARKQGVRTRKEQVDEMLERRRTSRPPSATTEALGFPREELEKRSLTYEGELRGQHHFTYLPEEIGTTFLVSEEYYGKGMIAEIDRKIFSLHIQFRKAFVPSVLEECTGSIRTTPALDGIPQADLKAVAKALHLLANGSEIEEGLVPGEYLDAWRRIKKSDSYDDYRLLYSRGVITKKEAETFNEAFEKVAHPTDALIRNIADSRSGESVSDADAEALRDIARHSEKNPLGVCERALRYIADSYTALTGDDTSGWDLDTLESKYLEMTIKIRRSIVDTIPDDLRKLVD